MTRSIAPRTPRRDSDQLQPPTTLYRVVNGVVAVSHTRRSRVSVRRPPGHPSPHPLLLVAISPDVGWQDFLDALHDLSDAIANNEVEGPADHEAVYGPDVEAA